MLAVIRVGSGPVSRWGVRWVDSRVGLRWVSGRAPLCRCPALGGACAGRDPRRVGAVPARVRAGSTVVLGRQVGCRAAIPAVDACVRSGLCWAEIRAVPRPVPRSEPRRS